MKNSILFSIFIVFVFVNILSFDIVYKSNLSLNSLSALAQLPIETGPKYIYQSSQWTEYTYTCDDFTHSFCTHISVSSWESPNGMYDTPMNCTIVSCHDCRTGLDGITYNDCD